MVVTRKASVQYGDLDGTIALDDGDFETLRSVLGIEPSWFVLGFSIFCNHPSLGIEGKDAADSSRTSLHVWVMADALLTEHSHGQGLPGVFAAVKPVPVDEFVFDTPDVEYGAALDAVSLVLRASKRVSIAAWDRTVVEAGLEAEDFDVVGLHTMVRDGGAWVEASEQY